MRGSSCGRRAAVRSEMNAPGGNMASRNPMSTRKTLVSAQLAHAPSRFPASFSSEPRPTSSRAMPSGSSVTAMPIAIRRLPMNAAPKLSWRALRYWTTIRFDTISGTNSVSDVRSSLNHALNSNSTPATSAARVSMLAASAVSSLKRERSKSSSAVASGTTSNTTTPMPTASTTVSLMASSGQTAMSCAVLPKSCGLRALIRRRADRRFADCCADSTRARCAPP